MIGAADRFKRCAEHDFPVRRASFYHDIGGAYMIIDYGAADGKIVFGAPFEAVGGTNRVCIRMDP